MTFETTTYKLIIDACYKSEVHKSVALLIGPTGSGKTTALKNYANGKDNILYVKTLVGVNPIDSKFNLLIVDGPDASLKEMRPILATRQNNRHLGLVVALKTNPFKKKWEVRKIFYELFGTVMSDSLPLEFQVRGKVKMIGRGQAFKNDTDLTQRLILSQHENCNRIYVLGKPTKEDVKSVCRAYGDIKGSAQIYLRAKTISDVLNEIQWKLSQKTS